MSTQVKGRRPVVTAAERKKWEGKLVTTSHVRTWGKRAGQTIVTEYRVVSVARFGPDKPLMLQVGSVDTGKQAFGVVGTYIAAADATLK